MLILTRKKGEAFVINGDIELVISEISGDQVKIGIQAPASYKILRKELIQTIESNRQAAHAPAASEMRSFIAKMKKE